MLEVNVYCAFFVPMGTTPSLIDRSAAKWGDERTMTKLAITAQGNTYLSQRRLKSVFGDKEHTPLISPQTEKWVKNLKGTEIHNKVTGDSITPACQQDSTLKGNTDIESPKYKR